jgi:exodeoxyribonuclease V alpha subunit
MTVFDSEVTIRRTRFTNPENGFAVVDAEAQGDPIVLIGPLGHLEERERAHILGSWVQDSRYGPQVKVREAHPLPPSDPATLAAYLRRVRHIGRKRAEALVERFGAAGVIEAIDAEPAAAFRAAGLGRFAAEDAARSWHELRVTRQLHLLLAPHGLGWLVGRLHTEYGSSAHRVLARNPYELTRLFGVGFATADRIARSLGPADAEVPGRARAALVHALSEAERSGSTCLPLGGLLEAAGELLHGPVDEAMVEELVAAGDLVRESDFVYRRATAELEEELAARVRELCEGPGKLDGADVAASDAGFRAGILEGGLALTDEQLAAVQAALTHRLSVVTGGPGTGKTATIKAIAVAAEQGGAKVMLVAPTGRAANRMTESSGLRASTVHSALGWVPGEGPTRDEDEPLRCDLLIVDESSMANLELMVMLLRAVPERAHVVLVGDADQLAPVGAGKPFAELIESGLVAVTRLGHIFRQAAGSMIVQGAHAVRRGEPPVFTPGPGMRRDLFLISRADPVAAREEIVSLVAERLPEHYGIDPVRDVQVFAPVYRGELGIDALNEALREALNPDGVAVRGGRLRIGDKLMMTGRNLHELGLMNGTLLRLLDEIEGGGGEEGALLLEGDEGVFRLPPEESERLRLAYACSVHRGQGIELPVAMIIAHPAAGAFFLRREMLYTAITRAKLATVIVGLPEVVARAARTADTGRRHSRLAARLAP